MMMKAFEIFIVHLVLTFFSPFIQRCQAKLNFMKGDRIDGDIRAKRKRDSYNAN